MNPDEDFKITIQPINLTALIATVTAIYGDTAWEALFKAYTAMDKMCFHGFCAAQQSVKGQMDALQARNAELSVANNGDYDDGYMDGVDDARQFPAVADATVRDMLTDEDMIDGVALFDGREAQSDSCDETAYINDAYAGLN